MSLHLVSFIVCLWKCGNVESPQSSTQYLSFQPCRIFTVSLSHTAMLGGYFPVCSQSFSSHFCLCSVRSHNPQAPMTYGSGQVGSGKHRWEMPGCLSQCGLLQGPFQQLLRLHPPRSSLLPGDTVSGSSSTTSSLYPQA